MKCGCEEATLTSFVGAYFSSALPSNGRVVVHGIVFEREKHNSRVTEKIITEI
jgi:hypothetical protein